MIDNVPYQIIQRIRQDYSQEQYKNIQTVQIDKGLNYKLVFKNKKKVEGRDFESIKRMGGSRQNIDIIPGENSKHQRKRQK